MSFYRNKAEIINWYEKNINLFFLKFFDEFVWNPKTYYVQNSHHDPTNYGDM